MMVVDLGLDEPEERCAPKVQPDQMVHDLQMDGGPQLAGLVGAERGWEIVIPGFEALFYVLNVV